MGMHMARNLHRAGLLAARLEPHRRQGDSAGRRAEGPPPPPRCPSSRAACDAVVTCVSADADVLDVIRALAPALKHGALVLDCSTVGAETARQAAELLAPRRRRIPRLPGERRRRGRARCDARHHGRRAAGRLRARAADAQGAGRTVTHFGPIGSGQAAKATNQIMCAGIIEAVAEAMAFAHAPGPAAGQADRHPRQGRRLQLVLRAPRAQHGRAAPTRPAFACGCTPRTWGSATTWRRASAWSCRWSSACWASTRELVARGYGDEDISATYRLKAELFERTNIMSAPPRRPT